MCIKRGSFARRLVKKTLKNPIKARSRKRNYIRVSKFSDIVQPMVMQNIKDHLADKPRDCIAFIAEKLSNASAMEKEFLRFTPEEFKTKTRLYYTKEYNDNIRGRFYEKVNRALEFKG